MNWQESEEWYGKKYVTYCEDLMAEILEGISISEEFPVSYRIYSPDYMISGGAVISVEEAKQQCEMILTPIKKVA